MTTTLSVQDIRTRLDRLERSLQKESQNAKNIITNNAILSSLSVDQLETVEMESNCLTEVLNDLLERFQSTIDAYTGFRTTQGSNNNNFQRDLDRFSDCLYDVSGTNSRLKGFGKTVQRKISTLSSAGNTGSTLRASGTSGASSSNPSSGGNGNITVKLPKLEIKKFDGNILLWKEFWDSYEATIHNNSNLSPVEKFNYLNSQLFGDAKMVISGLDLTNSNYTVAVDLLLKRYGNPQAVISAIHSALIGIPSVPNYTPRLRSLYDELECKLRSLTALGQNVNDQHFVTLILAKLPKDLRMILERTKGSNKGWSVPLVRQLFHEELTTRESVERIQICNPKSDFSPVNREMRSTQQNSRYPKPRSTGQTLISSVSSNSNRSRYNNYSPKCIFCNDAHWSDDCTKYRTFRDRKSQLKGRCYICLSKEHQQSECQVIRPCYHCKSSGKHHRSLCVVKFGKGKPESAQVAASSEANSGSTSTDSAITAQSKTGDNSDLNSVALLASEEKVFLQTAMIMQLIKAD